MIHNRFSQLDESSPLGSAVSTNRRNFLKLLGGAGAGLTLAMSAQPVLSKTTEQLPLTSAEGELEANAFVRISADSTVTVVIKHLEMGQGTYTGLATLVAEELDADWAQIKSEGAPANTGRYKNLHWGSQGTGGSSAIANSYEQMRLAGATARKMLVQAAAQQWQVAESEIAVSQGVVSHPGSNRSTSFGELVDQAAKLPMPATDSVQLKDPGDFKLIGRSVPRKDRGKTDGSALFTQDIKLPGMLTALVAHPPRFGATVKSVNSEAARNIAGVEDVVEIPTGVAVLAKDYWAAKKGRDALQIQWDESQAFNKSSDQLLNEFAQLAKQPGLVARNDGDTESALGSAAKVVEATFEFPFLAHAAMEPMNCVALVSDEGCEVWNGEQMQTLDQATIAATLGLKPEQVKINMLFAGGSFGRRANPHSDYVMETVHIAKAKPGIPVKLVWSREDDTRAGYYRPMYLHKVRAALDTDGNPVAWEQRIVGQSIVTGTPFEGFLIKDGIDATSVEGAATLPYSIPNLKVDLHTVNLPVPVQWWRSVGHTHTGFSTEVMIDELARAAGKDPVAFRLALLKDHPREYGVLKLAAEKANWGAPLPQGWGRGIAMHKSFNSYVAQVAEVSLQDNGQFKVERVICAVDCGVAINPDVIRAQMEGGIGFGLSPALMSEITFKDGQVVQSNFHDYQVLRIGQMPDVEVHIVPSAEPPTGVGEPGVPPIAPAVANALSAVTGQRFHRLPLKLS
ncbi:MAG: xanthine dehydrogenase family protein molybdopterin-binding subunit [Motiliproteus sp.]|nr:xanthine dehydrogenase family protein molybdopterin-binding subunit [Motiliproteus sp.]MCW9054013.1 xanthine dehydrogenase family protein molybdopterin-binding subunit [Motiliproteus sp.]